MLYVQKQDVTIVDHHLVHWEDSDSLAASTMNVISAVTLWCMLYVQKQDVTILDYHLVHWEDSDSLAASTMNVISAVTL